VQAPWRVGRASSSYPLLRYVSVRKLSLPCPPACLPTVCRHKVGVTCKGGCRRGWEQTLSEMGALSRSFLPLHIFSFLITRTDQTTDHRWKPESGESQGTPTSGLRQTCEAPRPYNNLHTSCNPAPRLDADAVRLLSLPVWMGRHPKDLRSAFRCRTEIDVPTADQGAHSHSLAGHGGYTTDEAYRRMQARVRRCKSFAVGTCAGERRVCRCGSRHLLV